MNNLKRVGSIFLNNKVLISDPCYETKCNHNISIIVSYKIIPMEYLLNFQRYPILTNSLPLYFHGCAVKLSLNLSAHGSPEG